LSKGRAAIKLAPKDAPAHLAVANAALAAGETAEAQAEYEKVLAFDKSNAEANAASGRSRARQRPARHEGSGGRAEDPRADPHRPARSRDDSMD
jgi:hypothetical protein